MGSRRSTENENLKDTWSGSIATSSQLARTGYDQGDIDILQARRRHVPGPALYPIAPNNNGHLRSHKNDAKEIDPILEDVCTQVGTASSRKPHLQQRTGAHTLCQLAGKTVPHISSVVPHLRGCP